MPGNPVEVHGGWQQCRCSYRARTATLRNLSRSSFRSSDIPPERGRNALPSLPLGDLADYARPPTQPLARSSTLLRPYGCMGSLRPSAFFAVNQRETAMQSIKGQLPAASPMSSSSSLKHKAVAPALARKQPRLTRVPPRHWRSISRDQHPDAVACKRARRLRGKHRIGSSE